MEAHSMPFSSIINATPGSSEHFHVPKYQREYTWGRPQWEQLKDDVEENDPSYFMGSLICVSREHAPGMEDIMKWSTASSDSRHCHCCLPLST